MQKKKSSVAKSVRRGENLNRVAFPLGGIGAGCFCVEGTGMPSHFQLRHNPDLNNSPNVFAALKVEGAESALVLEGPVPKWKAFGLQSGEPGLGLSGKNLGLPRFEAAEFSSEFPFAKIKLSDSSIPLKTEIAAWSPFVSGGEKEADDSSLPVAALEYAFENPTGETVEATFSFNAENFMKTNKEARVEALPRGIVLTQPPDGENNFAEGSFVFWCDDPKAQADAKWFRGGWFDPITMLWKKINSGVQKSGSSEVQKSGSSEVQNHDGGAASSGGSVFVPFKLKPGAKKTIKICCAWYVPRGKITSYFGGCRDVTHEPWYAGKFAGLKEVAEYFAENYKDLRKRSEGFAKRFYSADLPIEFIEAAGNNLSILKSPTMLRQKDGRLWCWEGCGEKAGSCHGTCTHVWNYAQALAHLFPSLERTLRETEFLVDQDGRGHQNFRAWLPIAPPDHKFHAAADGQLGGIMKLHREWKISGDLKFLKKMWPAAKKSLEYCIGTWDPERAGALVEPHHNTYDIEFWGPDGMCQSFYCGALAAAVAMATAMGDHKAAAEFGALHAKSVAFMENELWNGEYFIQKVRWQGLRAGDPTQAQTFEGYGSPESLEILKAEGPKYQYGNGCLSDGVLGAWIAWCCGVDAGIDPKKIRGHLKAVFKHNFRATLKRHTNTQRPGFALGDEPGLLLCSWPRGDKPSLPFVYCDEVFTGIEYQVASHLLSFGMTKEALAIVRAIRARYDGRYRNPYDEYECGHWYGRALASYAFVLV
ncbi:MAG: non-lysosomal glucosylceramidase [Kiritimatiellaeota bacterium]|nr:non-lysosomal glucosylceramidase [Kiritimatiellota bacterium]